MCRQKDILCAHCDILQPPLQDGFFGFAFLTVILCSLGGIARAEDGYTDTGR